MSGIIPLLSQYAFIVWTLTFTFTSSAFALTSATVKWYVAVDGYHVIITTSTYTYRMFGQMVGNTGKEVR